jgi:hypothetical protein
VTIREPDDHRLVTVCGDERAGSGVAAQGEQRVAIAGASGARTSTSDCRCALVMPG